LNERITGKKKRKKAKGVGGKGELDEWEDEDVEVTDAGGKAVDQVPSDVGKAGMEAEATTGDVGVDVADEIT